jgi:hypothetical protein
MALVNQQIAADPSASGRNSNIVFLNPLIYGIGQSPNYSSVFHDITQGTNQNSTPCTPGTLGCLPAGFQGFSAVPGYDLVTGWGTPNGPTAFNVLAPTTTGNPNFTLTASPSTLNLTPGSFGTSTISLTGLNGFKAGTNLQVVIPGAPSNVPAGFSASLSASTIPAGGGPATLTVNTSTAMAGGDYLVAVVGTSGPGCTGPTGGCLKQTAYVHVALPMFLGLSSSFPGVSVRQGGTATMAIAAATINGFNSPISFSASGLPSGVTASVAQVNPQTANLTVTASSSAALTGASGPYTLTVTGTAAGSAPGTTTSTVLVNPPLSGGTGTPVNLSSAYNVYAMYSGAQASAITQANSVNGTGCAF